MKTDPTQRGRRHRLRHAPAAVAGLLLVGCATQRLPGPLFLPDGAEPLPTGQEPGVTTQAVVMRHSDTVAIQPPGEMGSRVLTFYRKRVRVGPGTWIHTHAEGKAEILWPGDASSLLLLGEGAVELGDPGREEPLFTFHDVSSARLTLTPEDRSRFPGGGELRGDPVVPSGPFLVERLSPELIRITNRSKRDALLAVGGEVLDLAAGYEREVPVLGVSEGGFGTREEPQTLEAGGIEVSATGELGRLEGAGAGFEARAPSELRALGVRVRLAPGERVVFSGLQRPVSASAPVAPDRTSRESSSNGQPR